MSQGLLDTSIFIAQEQSQAFDATALPEDVMVSAITVGELLVGVLAADDVMVRATRMSTLRLALSFDAIPVDEDVSAAWVALRVGLQAAGTSMGVNDTWIAATAMALRVPVITRDQGFATGIPGLEVIHL
jgi:predicted nucleic acid-binding protein